MSVVLRGWFASRLSIGRARKCLILQRTQDGYEWQRSIWFDFKGDKSTVALGKDKNQFIYPSDFAFHQKNVDVYMKQVEDGAPIDVAGAPIKRREGVYPDPFQVHLWGAQKVVKDLLSVALSANWLWILLGFGLGAAIFMTVGIFVGPSLIKAAGVVPVPTPTPVPLVLPW